MTRFAVFVGVAAFVAYLVVRLWTSHANYKHPPKPTEEKAENDND